MKKQNIAEEEYPPNISVADLTKVNDIVTMWQTLISFVEKPYYDVATTTSYLKKHYSVSQVGFNNMDDVWRNIFSYLEERKHIDFFDKLFEIGKMFKISLNTCRCKGDKYKLLRDANGDCKTCGLYVNTVEVVKWK